jgi:cellulose biosynthesis protein BcsQ
MAPYGRVWEPGSAHATHDTLVVLVPLQAHVFALKALPQLDETIATVRQLDPALAIGGIVVTRVDRRTSVSARPTKRWAGRMTARATG